MENKFNQLFSENNFDFQEPHRGHLERFERKLDASKKINHDSWKWFSVAASIVLIIGFWLGKNHTKHSMDLADVSPKMKEVQTYFRSTIQQELKTVEKNRNLETETIIENAFDELEELEDNYKTFVIDLTKNGQQIKIINAMIKNYQQRLEILENLLKQIQNIKNPNTLDDEIYI